MINKKILYCSLSLILGGSLFVIHDAIINHLTEIEFKFYHHVFFGSPWLILIFIYLYSTGKIKTYLGSSSISIDGAYTELITGIRTLEVTGDSIETFEADRTLIISGNMKPNVNITIIKNNSNFDSIIL